MAAGSGVARRKLRSHLLFTCSLKLFGGAEAAVGGTVREEQFNAFAVDLRAFRLTVGAVRAADVGAFVPCEAEPAEGVEDLLLGGGNEAGAVGIFNAQHEIATALAGLDVVDEADVRSADVGVTGGVGRDAYACGDFGDVRAIRNKRPSWNASR